MGILSKYAFSFFFLITLFSGEIFGCYLSMKGIDVASGMLQKFYILIAVISYLILLKQLIIRKNTSGFLRVISILASIIILMSLTYISYDQTPKEFITSLYYFGSICVASAISGATLASNYDFKQIDILLPYFLIPISLIITTLGYASAMANGLVNTGTGLDYQNVSYYCAELFAYCCYALFFSSTRKSSQFRYLKLLVALISVFCAAICFISGGRGGAVLLGVYVVCIIWSLNYKRVFKKYQIIILIIISAVILVIIADYLNLWDTAGFSRITSTISSDSNRTELHNRSWKIFLESGGFGDGLGSIWINLGIYSHNIFYDLLAEIGVIGLIVVSFCIIKIFKGLISLSKYIPCAFLMLLIFLKGFVLCQFSGYWINTYQIWFAVGFVFAFNYKQFILRNKFREKNLCII